MINFTPLYLDAMNRLLILVLLVCFLITACTEETNPTSINIPVGAPTQTFPALAVASLPTATQKPKKYSPITPAPTRTSTPTSAPQASQTESADWKDLPVIPETVDASLQKIYEKGLELGNDPHAFSIFGDCQERPKDFFGVFENDPAVIESLSPELQEVVANFQGSFNRESPTAQDGTTPGSLLWTQWHRGEYGCKFSETPVQCELRIHHPSFVIIQIEIGR